MSLNASKLLDCYDIVIVGASFSGCLAALRLAVSNPNMRIVILEKAGALGGRKRSTVWEKKTWSSGTLLVSESVFDFLINSLRSLGCDKALEVAQKASLQKKTGLISSNNLKLFDGDQVLAAKGLKYLGGASEAKQWEILWKEIEAQKHPLSVAKAIKVSQKGPFANFLKTIGYYLGCAQFFSTSCGALLAAYKNSISPKFLAAWDQVFSFAFEHFKDIDVLTDCAVVSGKYQKDKWVLQTQKGDLKAKRLVVSHSPWELSKWIDKKDLPTSLIKSTLKLQPTTLVTLAKKIKGKWKGPCSLFIPSEGVKVLIMDEVAHFMFPIAFEASMNAPSVVKAIRKLRRSNERLSKIFSELPLENEHIALSSIGVDHSTMVFSPFFENSTKQLNQKNLVFCGSFYGSSFDPEKNILSSIVALDSWIKSER